MVASTQYLTVNSTQTATTDRSVVAPPTQLTVSYDAAAATYSLQNDERTRQFGPLQLVRETSLPDTYPRVEYQQIGSNEADFVIFFKSPFSSPSIIFSHAGHGVWQHNTPVVAGTRVRLDYFSYGQPTPIASMPRTGTATYRFFGTGNYAENALLFFVQTSGTMRVDFAAGTFTANVGLIGSDFFGGNFGGVHSFQINGTLSPNANGASGPLTYAGGDWLGRYRLQFYGPQAEELGVAFSVAGSRGTANGAFIAVTP